MNIGDIVVYPPMGVGKISKNEVRNIGGKQEVFYEMKMNNGSTLLFPAEKISQYVRKLSTLSELNDIFQLLAKPCFKSAHIQWNRRHRMFHDLLVANDLISTAKIILEIESLKFKNTDISYGENVMLQKARSRIAEEIALITKTSEENSLKVIDSIIGSWSNREIKQ